MLLKFSHCVNKSVRKQIKFTEHVYHKQTPIARKYYFRTCVFCGDMHACLLLRLGIVDGSLSPPLLDMPKRLIRWRVNVLGESSLGVSLANMLSLVSRSSNSSSLSMFY